MADDTFDVHTVPVGPVDGFVDADTVGEAKLTAAALARMGGRPVEHAMRPDMVSSLSEADDALARWSTRRDGEDRSSALLWFGHGQAREIGAVLHVPRTEPGTGNAFVTPAMFAHHIYDEQTCRQRADADLWAIVVIEACNGKNFVGDVANLFTGTKQPPGRALLLVGSGQTNGPGYLGQFREELEKYLDLWSHHDEVFTLRDIEVSVCGDDTRFTARILGGDAGAEFRLVPPGDLHGAGAITVADQQRLRAGETLAPVSASQVAAGASHLEAAIRFAGRDEDLRKIAEWAADPGGSPVLAVTGSPGVGKSALLAEAVRRGTASGLPDVVAVLPLTGSTPGDVTRRLATLLDVHGQDVPAIEAVRTYLGSGPADGQRLIVADALDEARDPVQVACVLRELTDLPGVRLLIGTRSTPSRDTPDSHETAGIDLLEVLGSRTRHVQVWTVKPDAEAARRYAENNVRRLMRQHMARGEEWRERLVRTVADSVAAHVRQGDWQFLHATLVVREIEERAALLSDSNALQQLLQGDRSGLFGAAVARITDGMPKAKAFLRALTYGHGRGLPRAEGIWARAAAGVAGDGTAADDGDLALFLHRAAAYVLLDGEDKRSVYRLAHRSFAEQLLDSGDADQERFGMFTSLLELADGQARRDERLSPHLRARLAEYAADCGSRGWTALAEHPAVLDRLPMPSLSALALSPRLDAGAVAIDLPIEVLGTVSSAHLIEASGPDDRPGLRQLGGLRATGRMHEAGPDAAWRVSWGRLRRVPPHLQLEGVDGAVSAVASDASARWLATGSLDGTVLVWEPWQRHRPSKLLRDCTSAVSAIAAPGMASESDVPTMLAAAHENRTVQLWDLSQESPTPQTRTSREVVRTMVAMAGDRVCFAIAGETGYVALLDDAGIHPQETEPPSRTDVVGIVAVTGHGGEQFVVTAQRSGHLGLWCAQGAAPTLRSFVTVHGELVGLAATTSGGETTLVTTAADGVAEYWKVNAGDKIVPVPFGQRDDRPRDLGRRGVPALLTLSGRSVPAFGLDDGNLLVPCPDGRFEPVLVWTKAIRAMTVLRGPQSGPVLAAIVERDARVHFWDPSVVIGRNGDTGSHLLARDMWRHVLADGAEALVVVEELGDETRERVLFVANGKEVRLEASAPAHPIAAEGVPAGVRGAAERRHSRVVSSVVLDVVGEHSDACVVATAGREGTVVIWLPSSLERWTPVRVIRLGSSCRGLAAFTGQRLAVSTDDGVLVLELGRSWTSGETENGDE